jgi:hypothetical protein
MRLTRPCWLLSAAAGPGEPCVVGREKPRTRVTTESRSVSSPRKSDLRLERRTRQPLLPGRLSAEKMIPAVAGERLVGPERNRTSTSILGICSSYGELISLLAEAETAPCAGTPPFFSTPQVRRGSP